MIITKVLCLINFLILFVKTKIYKENLLRYDNLLNFVLSVTIFISTFKFARFQHDFGLLFNISYVLMIFFFYFGYKISNQVKIQKKFQTTYNKKKFNYCVFVITLLILITFFYTWHILGTPPGLGGQVSRNAYFLGKLEGIYVLIYLLIFLIFYDFFNDKCLGIKFWIYLAIILFLIVARANKFTIFYLVLVVLILYNSYVKKIKLKHIIIISIISVLIFVSSFNLFYNKMNDSTLEQRVAGYQVVLPKNMEFLTDIYLYISCNYENINNYMENYSDHNTYGYYSFKSVNDLIKINGLYFKIDPNIDKYWTDSLQYKTLNTGSIFRDFFLDFSLVGVVFFSFFIGLFSGWVEKNFYKNRNSIFASFLYCIVSFTLFMAYFTNFFSNILFLINLLAALIVSYFVMSTKGEKN